MGPEGTGFRVTPQAVLGLVIITIGLLLTADNLNLVETEEVLRYWPVGIILVGLAKLAQPGDRSGRVFGALIVLVGAWITADQVYGLSVQFRDWWPLVLVVVGLLMVVRGGSRAAARTVSDQTISEFAFWAGIRRRVASPAFRRGDLTAIMGGVEVDLRAAGTSGGEAVIDVFVLWGGVEITVPPDWAVANKVLPIMGGADDKSTGQQDARHRLTVRGFVIMGGVEIKT